MFISFFGAAAAVDELVERDGSVRTLGDQHPAVQLLASLQRGPVVTSVSAAEGAMLVAGLLGHLAGSGLEASAERLLQAARDAVAAHVPGSLTVADLAAKLTVSREHLTRVFTAELGIGPGAWMNQEQIRHACQLLRASNDDLTTIAHASGFPSASRLCKVFRRTLGCTPGDYRKSRYLPVV